MTKRAFWHISSSRRPQWSAASETLRSCERREKDNVVYLCITYVYGGRYFVELTPLIISLLKNVNVSFSPHSLLQLSQYTFLQSEQYSNFLCLQVS